jgi:hypothetical protein
MDDVYADGEACFAYLAGIVGSYVDVVVGKNLVDVGEYSRTSLCV